MVQNLNMDEMILTGKFCSNCGANIQSPVDALGGRLAATSIGVEDVSFEEAIFSLQRSEDVVLVLLGKSGVGKSTWINSFFNFLKHRSFESALSGPVYAPICTKFHHADHSLQTDVISQRLVTIQVGTPENHCEEYAKGNVTASATAMPMSHKVVPKDESYSITLIDTPGVRATSGKGIDNSWKDVEETDRENLNTILSHISQYDYINAFIILLKPDEEKLDPAFAYSIKMLFSQLHDSAKLNVIFAFTHASYCNFDDTKTVLVLDGYLKEIGLDIKIRDSNVFYFDSTPFRYLATISNEYKPKEDHYLVKRCWQRSIESCQKMLRYVDKLEKHDTNTTISIYEAKCMVTLVVNPLVKICKVNEENIAVVKKAFEDLANESGRTTMKTIREKVLIYKKLDKPLTVCTNKECSKQEEVFEDGQQVLKNLYDPICCVDCYIPFVSNQEPGSFMLYFCSAMSYGKCKVCKHSKNEHMHIVYELQEAAKLFCVETKDIGQRKKDLEGELNFIVDTLAYFSQYLQQHSLIKDRDLVSYHIEQELKKATQDLGIQIRRQTELQEKIKSIHYIRKITLKGLVKNAQQSCDLVEKKVKYLQGIWNLRKQVRDIAIFDFVDARPPNAENVLLQKEQSLSSLLKKQNITNEQEYWSILQAEQLSAMEYLNEKTSELKSVEDLEESQRIANEKTMLIDGLQKINKMYEEKLTINNGNPTPKQVKDKIDALCHLKHNGPTFNDIYANILKGRRKHANKKPKVYKLFGGSIPKEFFSNPGFGPVETYG